MSLSEWKHPLPSGKRCANAVTSNFLYLDQLLHDLPSPGAIEIPFFVHEPAKSLSSLSLPPPSRSLVRAASQSI